MFGCGPEVAPCYARSVVTVDDRILSPRFLLLSVVHFLHALAFNLYLHFGGFLQQLGAQELQIGLIVGLTGATAVLARPALGRAMDLRGRRVVILCGGALHVGVCLAYLTVTALGPWVYAVRVLHGMAEAALFASLFAYATDILPASRRIQGIALFGVSGLLPMSLGGLLGDALLGSGGYRPLFAVAGGLGATALALSTTLGEVPRPPGEPPRGLLPALLQRDLLPLWVTGLCFATAIASYFSFMKTFVLLSGVGSVGLFYSAYSIAAVSLRLVGSSWPERLGPRRTLLGALTSLCAGLFVLAMARDARAIGCAGVLCGLGHGFCFPILLGLVVSRARPTERGAALAIFTALFDGGTLVGGPLLGAIVTRAGYPSMFIAAAGLVVAGALTFQTWDRRAVEAVARGG